MLLIESLQAIHGPVRRLPVKPAHAGAFVITEPNEPHGL